MTDLGKLIISNKIILILVVINLCSSLVAFYLAFNSSILFDGALVSTGFGSGFSTVLLSPQPAKAMIAIPAQMDFRIAIEIPFHISN